MTTTLVTIAEARDQLSTHVRSAEHGDRIVITRHGRPVAALVSASTLAQLERLEAAGPEQGLAGVAGGWAGTDDLVRAIERVVRTKERPSDAP